MPALFGAGTVHVTGGRKVARFIRRNAPDVAAELAARKFAATFPISLLRQAVRHRTGRLAGSLTIHSRGSVVYLRGVFYGRFRPNRGDIERAFVDLATQHLRNLRWIRR